MFGGFGSFWIIIFVFIAIGLSGAFGVPKANDYYHNKRLDGSLDSDDPEDIDTFSDELDWHEDKYKDKDDEWRDKLDELLKKFDEKFDERLKEIEGQLKDPAAKPDESAQMKEMNDAYKKILDDLDALKKSFEKKPAAPGARPEEPLIDKASKDINDYREATKNCLTILADNYEELNKLFEQIKESLEKITGYFDLKDKDQIKEKINDLRSHVVNLKENLAGNLNYLKSYDDNLKELGKLLEALLTLSYKYFDRSEFTRIRTMFKKFLSNGNSIKQELEAVSELLTITDFENLDKKEYFYPKWCTGFQKNSMNLPGLESFPKAGVRGGVKYSKKGFGIDNGPLDELSKLLGKLENALAGGNESWNTWNEGRCRFMHVYVHVQVALIKLDRIKDLAERIKIDLSFLKGLRKHIKFNLQNFCKDHDLEGDVNKWRKLTIKQLSKFFKSFVILSTGNKKEIDNASKELFGEEWKWWKDLKNKIKDAIKVNFCGPQVVALFNSLKTDGWLEKYCKAQKGESDYVKFLTKIKKIIKNPETPIITFDSDEIMLENIKKYQCDDLKGAIDTIDDTLKTDNERKSASYLVLSYYLIAVVVINCLNELVQ